jgi:peptidoglycan/xylan/chitin deacetylase (PgdA/CDA1 family)
MKKNAGEEIISRIVNSISNKYMLSKFMSLIRVIIPLFKSGLTRPLVTLTFDDADITQFTNGWPVMQKYGMLGTFYITTDRLDGHRGMYPNDVVTLFKSGNHIGSHSVSHPHLTQISFKSLIQELTQSQIYLQKLLGVPVKDFALPYGDYNNPVISQVKKNYRSNRTTNIDINTKRLDLYKICSIGIVNTTHVKTVQSWIDLAKKNNNWLVFLFHNIEENPNQWGISPKNFDKQLSVIKKSGILIVTLEQAITEITQWH